MSNLKKDENRITTLGAVLNTDGSTIAQVKVNPTDHSLKVANGTTGDDYSSTNIQKDNNREPVLWGVSSADGVTPVSIYVDSAGKLLIKST
jgi:hypothetical protein